MMRSFEFISAKEVTHALDALKAPGRTARVIAGGTDLLPELRLKNTPIDAIVDISSLRELKGIYIDRDGLRIGALTTHADIIRSPVVREHVPVLVEAAQSIGAVQTRNLGTIGGNLAACVPCMDSGPALMALDARITIVGPEGPRECAIADMFVGPRRTSLRGNELLKEIRIPAQSFHKPAAFVKFGLRKGQALALANVAASLRIGKNGLIQEPAVALGAVAATVMRAIEAEQYLDQKRPTRETFIQAAQIVANESEPIDDHRASASYRRSLVAALLQQALRCACAMAGHSSTETA